MSYDKLFLIIIIVNKAQPTDVEFRPVRDQVVYDPGQECAYHSLNETNHEDGDATQNRSTISGHQFQTPDQIGPFFAVMVIMVAMVR